MSDEMIENEVDWDYGMTFEKLSGINDSVMYIAGEASNPDLDHDNENMDMDSLRNVFKTYMQNPIIRFMHDKAPQWRGAIGTVVEKYIDSEGKEHVTSFGEKPYLVAKIEKEHVPGWMWNSIKNGVYKGFSIGGKALKKVNGTIFVKSWLETSIVDVPSASGAFFTVLKSACESGNCPYEKGGVGSGQKGHKSSGPGQNSRKSPLLQAMAENDKKIAALKGEKIKMSNPVSRASYESQSLKAGKWLSVEEFENAISRRLIKTPILDKFIYENGEIYMKVNKFLESADSFIKGGVGSGQKGHRTSKEQIAQKVNKMDELFDSKVKHDLTEGSYKDYKPHNKDFVFYDDLSQSQKEIIVRNNLKFDLIGRIHDGDHLISKEQLNKLFNKK